jgi:hypothetical protein
MITDNQNDVLIGLMDVLRGLINYFHVETSGVKTLHVKYGINYGLVVDCNGFHYYLKYEKGKNTKEWEKRWKKLNAWFDGAVSHSITEPIQISYLEVLDIEVDFPYEDRVTYSIKGAM